MMDREDGRIVLTGTGGSSGIGMGRASIVSDREIVVPDHTAEDPAAEKELFLRAHATVVAETAELLEKTKESAGEEAAEIFDLHASLLNDSELMDPILERISVESANAALAVDIALDELAAVFRSMDDAYMRERSADILDIKSRLLVEILQPGAGCCDDGPKESCVVVAVDLSPSDTAKLDLSLVEGIVTARGGATSHAAILARTLSIPAVICIGDEEIKKIPEGAELVLDGDSGRIVVNPDDSDRREFSEFLERREEKKRRLLPFRDRSTETRDGHSIQLMANIGTPGDIERVLENGAEGIGLFRSEFLFLDRNEAPTEEEQYRAYRKVLESMGDKPVIVRTLDIGGDKEVPYLNLPAEDNPFLGNRAIRLCLGERDLFLVQLKALLRAGTAGNLHIMFPMIVSPEELREAKAMVAKAKSELLDAGLPFLDEPKIGIMIETPAAALMAGVLAGECDFFSIGTNDLTQYTLAVDRGNRQIADLYSPFHPAVLSLIKATVSAAAEKGIPCGICGEAAASEELVPLFVGFGVHELSMVPGAILETRAALSGTTKAECDETAGRVSELDTAAAVQSYLRKRRKGEKLGE